MQYSKLSPHHYNYSYDDEKKKLMPSWVTQSELTSYLEYMENNSAPPELLALKQLNGHVPYVNHINVADVLLAALAVPHTATLEDGLNFVSRLQQ